MASITVAADGSEQKFALENPAVTLGRGLESDIRLKDIKASRRHCQIVKTPQGYQCLDLSSGNGTFINGVQIKQQMLSEGDKIQIGSTVITFHDANGAVDARARSAAPAASAPKPTTARAGASKPATAVLPAAPTRKMTAKVDVVKPATQSAPKPGTQGIPKTGTQGVPKPGTQPIAKAATTAMKKTGATQRMGSTTRATGKISATQRFHAEGRKKKASPVAVMIGLIIAAFVVVTACILFLGGDDPELVRTKFQDLTAKAAELDNKGDLEGALKKYREAQALIAGNKDFKGNEAALKGNIQEIEGRIKAKGDANAQFQEFDAKAQKATEETAYALWQEGKKLYDHYESGGVAFLTDLKKRLDSLEEMSRKHREKTAGLVFTKRRSEIDDQCKLGTKAPNYGEALKLWKEYIDNKLVSKDDREKAEGQVTQINRRAAEEAVRIGKQVDRAIEEKTQATLLENLGKEVVARFEGTTALDDLKKHLARLEQK